MELSREEMAADIADQLMRSQRVAEAVSAALNQPGLDPSPLEMVFAGILLDKIFQKRIPHYEQIRNWAIENWQKLEEFGAIPDASEREVQSEETV